MCRVRWETYYKLSKKKQTSENQIVFVALFTSFQETGNDRPFFWGVERSWTSDTGTSGSRVRFSCTLDFKWHNNIYVCVCVEGGGVGL